MRRNIKSALLLIVLGSFLQVTAEERKVYFDMDLAGNKIEERISGKRFIVQGAFAPENISGAKGNALRFDGYTTYVDAELDMTVLNGRKFSFSVLCAAETYPMMNADAAVNSFASIAGNINNESKSGFAMMLSSQGDYSFDFYANGWKVSCKANRKLGKYVWNELVATVDAELGVVRLFCNAELVGEQQFNGVFSVGDSLFRIGKSFDEVKAGIFDLDTFNGLIDEIGLYDGIVENPGDGSVYGEPDLSVPEARFEGDIMRPVLHGMPDAAWTNETHGMFYRDGKYHLFFQKNANGPYWGRLHWGHLTSENLYNWKEEKIALAPSADYDWKGCWSGCVYEDEALTNGEPHLLYTAVDNAKATIAEAKPVDSSYSDWEKMPENPIINGKPQGLSDDFRDPYVFVNEGKKYMIVGTSKDGVGAATLHRYNEQTKSWSNDGSLFFKGRNASVAGRFWEMPAVIPMGNEKWLLVVTPLDSRRGVEALYWIGTINEDGTFNPMPLFANEPKEWDLGTMSEQGYGLLSPTFLQLDNGNYLALGIVPDKLSSELNYKMGWAHTYSLPREVSLNENNELIQKPFSQIVRARKPEISFCKDDFVLNGVQEIENISGRAVEARIKFRVGQTGCTGFQFYKNNGKAVEVYYDASSNKLTVDASKIERWENDKGVFDGKYETYLPARVNVGDVFDLHVFIDHSVMDLFVNEKWAASIRIFPTESSEDAFALLATEDVQVDSVEAYLLDPKCDNPSGMMDTTVGITDGPVSFWNQGNLYFYGITGVTDVQLYDLTGKLLFKGQICQNDSMSWNEDCIVCLFSDGRKFVQKILTD